MVAVTNHDARDHEGRLRRHPIHADRRQAIVTLDTAVTPLGALRRLEIRDLPKICDWPTVDGPDLSVDVGEFYMLLGSKTEDVLSGTVMVFGPLLLALASRAALVAAINILVVGAAAVAIAIQFWGRLAIFIDTFFSIGWATTAAFAVVSLWVAWILGGDHGWHHSHGKDDKPRAERETALISGMRQA